MEGIKNALTRKIGPLPVYAWGLMVVAAIALVIVWRRSHASSGNSVLAGGGGTNPTDWTAVSADPGLVPLPASTGPSAAPAPAMVAAPVAPALSTSTASFAPVRSSTTPLRPVIPASNVAMPAPTVHAIPRGPLAGVVPQGPSPAARSKNKPQPSGVSQMWTGARSVAGQAAALQTTQLSPLGAQANPHGRERT